MQSFLSSSLRRNASDEIQNVKRKWLSCLLCGKPEKRKIMLCYHSCDEGNVKKFLKTLDSIGADVICKNETDDRENNDTYRNFRRGIVLICLSKEYVVDPCQEKDFQLVSKRTKNDLSFITFDPMVSKWQKHDKKLLVFDDVNKPSIFTLRKKCQGQSSKQFIYISNHPKNVREVDRIRKLLKKEHNFECLKSKYQTSSSGISNDVILKLTEDFTKASKYVLYLSKEYNTDEFCQFEQKVIENQKKRVTVYVDHGMDFNSVYIPRTWTVPYEDDEAHLKTTLNHTFNTKDVKKIILISSFMKRSKLEETTKRLFRDYVVYSTSELEKTKKYSLIEECEIYIACLSQSFMEDAACKTDMELANALWKRILPLEKDGCEERPEWLVRIVGEHRYPQSLEEYSDIHHENKDLEEWIRKKIIIPFQPRNKNRSVSVDHTMTDAYGSVEVFAEGGLEHHVANYVRLSTRSDLNVVSSLLMKHWGLSRPKLLISITGEGSEILNDPVKTRFFTSAFENIIKEKGVWFTTDGASSGISKVIGQIVENKDINERPTIIGVASWEHLKMNKDLLLKNGFGRWPALYNTREAKDSNGNYYLNPFCTHFLLPVTCRRSSETVSTAEFRTNLEEFIRRGRFKKNKSEDDFSVSVPSVLLVVEGDEYQSVSMIRRALDKQQYVIVFKGTGGLADMLASVSDNNLRSDNEQIMEIVKHENSCEFLKFVDVNSDIYEYEYESLLIEVLSKDIGGTVTVVDVVYQSRYTRGCSLSEQVPSWILFIGTGTVGVHKCIQKLLRFHKSTKVVLRCTEVVTVGTEAKIKHYNKPSDLRYIISDFNTCITIDSNEEKLYLTLAFNNPEKAKEHVFNTPNLDLTDTFKNKLMVHAMRDGKREFVRLLIKECIDIHKFQKSKYDQLFQDGIPNELKRWLGETIEPSVENIAWFVAENLKMDLFGTYEWKRSNVLQEEHDAHNGIIESLKKLASNQRVENKSDPYFYLMIWAILMMNLQDLAKFFWQHCREPLPSALIAYGIYKALRKNCQATNKLLRDKLFHAEREFQDLACGVLNQCYADKPVETDRILTRKRPRWRNLTCLEIAYKMKAYSFMSHEACNIPINRVWFGKISPNTTVLRLMLSVFILGLFPFVLPFERSEVKNEKDDSCMTKIRMRIYHFYTAPIMRFSHTMVSYVLFLAFFSYALLTGFGEKVTWVEILMYVWISCLYLGESREIIDASTDYLKEIGLNISRQRRSPYFLMYISDKWNYFDYIAISFFVIGVGLNYYQTQEVGRVFLAISLIAYFMRLLKSFLALEELGPKVWMIASMAKDLLYFVVILMLFVVSYAVAAYAIMYPQSEISIDLVLQVLRLGYWNLYGELLLDDIEAEEPDCTFLSSLYNNDTLPRCAVKHHRIIGLVMMGIYLIFANVMLLNILIAMFTDTYQRIQTEKDQKWSYERFALVREFSRVPIIPMPPGALFIICSSVRYYKTMKRQRAVGIHDEKLLSSINSTDTMFVLEREIVYLYMKKRSEDSRHSALMEERIAQIEKKLNRLQSKQS